MEKSKCIDNITVQKLRSFSENLFKRVFLQTLIQGNVTVDTAMMVSNKLLKTLNSLPLQSKPERVRFV